MTNEQMRIVIAEERGWVFSIDKSFPFGVAFLNRAPDRTPIWKEWDEIPNYPEDLNAMHDAEKELLPSERIRYWNILGDVIIEANKCSWSLMDLAFATAHQRAKTFIKTRCPERWVEE